MLAADAELVRIIAARAEDAPAAEAELCRRFAPRIRLYGLRHLGDEDRAADLVQAVLLAVLQAARGKRIEDPERVDRFMLGASRNVSQRMREVDGRATSDAEMDQVPDRSRPEAYERVDAAALATCMAALDDRSRQVVMMSFNDERPADEIAKLLGLTAGNVRVVRHRAIAALRRCLDAKQEPHT
jgi:RNA polymerase sigma-70 factor (ECF subfamily)